MCYNEVDDQEKTALVVPPEIIRIPTTDKAFNEVHVGFIMANQ